MFNHDHRIASVHQLIQHTQQYVYIFEVQTGGRFVEDIQCFPGIFFGQFSRQFHPLGFTSGNGCGRLSQCQITQAHILQCFQLMNDRRNMFKKLHRLVNGHIQHIINRLSFIAYFQCFAVISFSLTVFAKHIHVRQEVHFYSLHAGPLTGFTASAFDIE